MKKQTSTKRTTAKRKPRTIMEKTEANWQKRLLKLKRKFDAS